MAARHALCNSALHSFQPSRKSSEMCITVMLESTINTFHTSPPTTAAADDDDNYPLSLSKSYYDHAISIQLPRLLYSPPVNFGIVTHRLYRSSFPQKENFAYLRRLGLNSVLYGLFCTTLMGFRTLVQEEYPPENLAFLESAEIKFFQFPIPANKEPFVVIPDVSIIGARSEEHTS